MGGPGSGRKPSGHTRGKMSGTSTFRFMTKESRSGNKRVAREMHFRTKIKHTVLDVRTGISNSSGNKYKSKKEVTRKTYVGRKTGRKA